MHFRSFVVAFVILGTFIAVAWAGAGAQVVAVNPVTPTVMTGGDVGFRVEGLRGSTPVGTLVVKVNGQWVAAEIAGIGSTPLSRR